MKTRGIDMGDQRSKGLAELPNQRWDYVVTMGCGDACPFVPSRARLDWQIPDPKGQPFDEVRRISQLIEAEISALIRRAGTEGFGAA